MVINNLGSPCRLIARILEVLEWRRQPSHYARLPEPGQLVLLGEGRSFVAYVDNPPMSLGLRPATRRKFKWLLVDHLYYVCHCRVDILWAALRAREDTTAVPTRTQ